MMFGFNNLAELTVKNGDMIVGGAKSLKRIKLDLNAEKAIDKADEEHHKVTSPPLPPSPRKLEKNEKMEKRRKK